TIQALLMRHYDPTSGRVLANGVNLKNIRPEDWSGIASSLTQDFSILERLIGAEIASSRLGEEVDKDAVMASCRFANFESVVQDDPMGLESQIGVAFGGREFSGGEKQRLALARVHYRRSPVLILDEPDASLDALSAERIIDNIFALKGVTVVLITHHVSRAEKCDHIIVMGKGKIAEQGTHDELMARNGAYVTLRNKDLERLGVHLGVLS
ncbi:MAG: ABC transporter ATP-binding protein, partial [Saprospiraceae bacterium]|nr:ABC transporter ATP-binding protein [Saprospiraceae bacterium]